MVFLLWEGGLRLKGGMELFRVLVWWKLTFLCQVYEHHVCRGRGEMGLFKVNMASYRLWHSNRTRAEKKPEPEVTHLRRTPPSREALRHSGGESLLCTSPTVTLYLEVELSRDRRPGTEQNTSFTLTVTPPISPSLLIIRDVTLLCGIGTAGGGGGGGVEWSGVVKKNTNLNPCLKCKNCFTLISAVKSFSSDRHRARLQRKDKQ